MTGLGTILNTACILIGGLVGLFIFRSISAATQRSLRSLLALVSLVIGFMMIWDGLNGSFPLKLNRSEPTSGGAGFQVGDVLEPVGGKAARSARLKVATIKAKGAIATLEIIEPGDYSDKPQPPIALAYPNDSTGPGRDATVKLAFNETSRGWLFRGYLLVLMVLSLAGQMGRYKNWHSTTSQCDRGLCSKQIHQSHRAGRRKTSAKRRIHHLHSAVLCGTNVAAWPDSGRAHR